MKMQSLTLAGKEYVVIERRAFDELLARTGQTRISTELPSLPQPDADGNVPAIAYARISMARKLILARHEAGLSQKELARRAGVRVETINRLEKGKHTPDEKTFNKIDRVLKAAEKAGATERRRAG